METAARSYSQFLRPAPSYPRPVAERTIRVFLASPGDVAQARATVVEIGRQVDEGVARPLGWRLDVYGWELGRPGLGRAQDLVNPNVDTCHVLVGVLGSDFGTPTGEYESGFEEEFERVRQRREAGEPVDGVSAATG